LIRLDVSRTNTIFIEAKEIKNPCQIDFDSGENPIYNILVAYAEFDSEIGYTQGMNFLVALIYAAVEDEVVVFGLLCKVMFERNWR
jgi:hypothetical protein